MRVNHAVKFSYNITKGSVTDRQNLVKKLNEEIFYSLKDLFEKGNPKLKEIKDIYKRILPETKKIDIVAMKPSTSFDGGADYIYSFLGKIKGQVLEIPCIKSRVSIDKFVTMMHENTHIIDTLVNPKYTALTQKLSLRGQYDKKRDLWFHKYLYIDEFYKNDEDKNIILENVRIETEKFLKKRNSYDKILQLQDARYELQAEKLAFDEQVKYAARLKKVGFNFTEDDVRDYDRLFLFTEKINLLKEMLAELIKKEREKIHKSNLKNKA